MVHELRLVGDEIRVQGRTPARASHVRDITLADLSLLELGRNVVAPNPVKIRDSHHALARCLALGMRPVEASIVTGYSASRISILQGAPQFQDLVEFYREQKNAAFADLVDRMSTLSLDTLEELRERMQDNPQQFKPNDLINLFEALADRTGHGPTSKTINANLTLSPEEMKQLTEDIGTSGVEIVDSRLSQGKQFAVGQVTIELSVGETETVGTEGAGEVV
jgi:hypothetical protein